MKKNNLTLILIALAIADLLGAIDSTGVYVALPTLVRDLHISLNLAQWVPNAFTLILVSTLILCGRLGDKYGYKKLYVYGLILFGLSSLLLGFANNAPLVIGTRALQGFAIAILYTMPTVIIAHLWREREKAFAVTASAFAGGMLVGPVLGGVLTGLNFGNFHGWHLLFLLNVPIVIVGLIISLKYIPEIPHKGGQKFDFLAVALLFSALIITTLSFSVIAKPYLLLGLALFVAIYFLERKSATPLLDFSIFNRTFTAANIISFISMVTMIGMSYVLTFYLQQTLGWSSTQAGFALLPIPFVAGIFSVIGGKIKNWRLAGFIVSIMVTLGLLMLALIRSDSTYWTGVLPGLSLIAGGSGILMTTLFAAMLGSVPTEKSATASGFLNTIQQVGSLVGIAIIAGIVLQYNKSFTLLLLISLLGIIAAFFVRNKTNIKNSAPEGGSAVEAR